MDVEVRGDVEVDELEEPQNVGARVLLAAVGDDLAGGDVECGEQVCRPVALVVVGHRPRPARTQREGGLGAVERLALRLLVEAEHSSPLGRV